MIIRRFIHIILFPVIVLSCASTVPVTKYMPQKSKNIFPFFVSGQPIAAVQSEDAFLLLSLEPIILARRPYIRLWLLYQNTSNEPYLLEPLRFSTLRVSSFAWVGSRSSEPESPTRILAHISNEKAAIQIMQAIGGTLQTMAVEPTTAKTRFNDGSSATTTFNDQSEKRDRVVDRTINNMTNTALWYDLFQNSFSSGILRRNTVFPGQSVNGFIYFPYGWDEDKTLGSMLYDYIVALRMPGGTQNVHFKPIEGE